MTSNERQALWDLVLNFETPREVCDAAERNGCTPQELIASACGEAYRAGDVPDEIEAFEACSKHYIAAFE